MTSICGRRGLLREVLSALSDSIGACPTSAESRLYRITGPLAGVASWRWQNTNNGTRPTDNSLIWSRCLIGPAREPIPASLCAWISVAPISAISKRCGFTLPEGARITASAGAASSDGWMEASGRCGSHLH
jgi:hypothetical protein